MFSLGLQGGMSAGDKLMLRENCIQVASAG